MKKEIIFGIIILSLLLPATMGAMAGNVKGTSFPKPQPDNWGIVLYTDTTTSYVEFGLPNLTWYGGPLMGYQVLAIGRHSIHWVIEYDVYTRTPDGLEQQTGSIDGNDSIYLFDIYERPVFRPYAENSVGIAFYLFDHGEWWCMLYVNGELKSEVYGSAAHH